MITNKFSTLLIYFVVVQISSLLFTLIDEPNSDVLSGGAPRDSIKKMNGCATQRTFKHLKTKKINVYRTELQLK